MLSKIGGQIFMDVNSSPLASPGEPAEEFSPRLSEFSNTKKKRSGDDQSEWSEAKRTSFETMETNPNAYFYRHVAPGQKKRTGAWDDAEKKLFLEVMKIHPPSQGKWGLFAQHIPGRVGYQCRNFYHRLLESGELTGDEIISEPKPEKAKPNKCHDDVIVLFSSQFACEEEVPRRRKQL